jgi:hypothetical protein
MDLEAIPPEPEMKDVFGGWEQIAAAVGRVVAQLPALGGSPGITSLLVALLDAQTGQADLLKSIKADTLALRTAPYKEAMHSLDAARRVGPGDRFWNIYIERAEAKLSEAQELVSDLREQTLVEYNRAIVYFTMGHQENGRYYIEQSCQHADQVVNEYLQKAKDFITDRRPVPAAKPRGLPKAAKNALEAGEVVVGFATIGTYFYARAGVQIAIDRPKERARRDLQSFIGFYNLIQHTASKVSDNIKPQYLTLEHSSPILYILKIR